MRIIVWVIVMLCVHGYVRVVRILSCQKSAWLSFRLSWMGNFPRNGRIQYGVSNRGCYIDSFTLIRQIFSILKIITDITDSLSIYTDTML